MSKKKLHLKNKKKSAWQGRIDLHGLTVDQALDQLDRYINDCLLDEKIFKVEIIHGLGTGKIKKAVLDYLAKHPSFKIIDHQPLNLGVTWIEL